MCAHLFACVCVCVCVCVRVCVCVCVHACVFMHVHSYLFLYVWGAIECKLYDYIIMTILSVHWSSSSQLSQGSVSEFGHQG